MGIHGSFCRKLGVMSVSWRVCFIGVWRLSQRIRQFDSMPLSVSLMITFPCHVTEAQMRQLSGPFLCIGQFLFQASRSEVTSRRSEPLPILPKHC